MRHILFSVLAAVILVAAPLTARAADLSIAVVDMQQILSESDAAKSILAQLKTRRDGMEKEIKGMEEALKKSEQDLIKKKSTMKPEEFMAARKDFEKKVMDSRVKVQKERQDADTSFNTAINELRGNILDVVAKIAETKKIQLVITKQNVVIGDKSLEITPDVMTQLNAKIKTIKVK